MCIKNNEKSVLTTHNYHLIRIEVSDKLKLRDFSQDTWSLLLANVKIMKNKKKLKSCHRSEESKKARGLDVMWHPLLSPWVREKNINLKTGNTLERDGNSISDSSNSIEATLLFFQFKQNIVIWQNMLTPRKIEWKDIWDSSTSCLLLTYKP